MKTSMRALITVVVLTALTLVSYWLWHHFLERVQQKMWHTSEAANADPLLAANRFLRSEGFDVDSYATLDSTLLNSLDSGVLLIAEGHAVSTYDDYEKLLAWIKKGGVLITQAEWDPGEEDERVTPLLGDDFDTWQTYDDDAYEELIRAKKRTNSELKDEPDSEEVKKTLAEIKKLTEDDYALPCSIDVPHRDHSLNVARSSSMLSAGEDAPESLWPQDECRMMRVYGYGSGKIVFLSEQPFNNQALRQWDHAEWLLTLVSLQQHSKRITLVQHFDIPPWYVWLWRHFSLTLLLLATGIVLLLWRHLPRFGPLLPAFVTERRALLEHIDASARWLWRSPAGRARLLTVLRQRVLKQLLRRRPVLSALRGNELTAAIAEWTAIPVSDVHLALVADVAKEAQAFTRQIHLLQRLRSHHEQH